MEFLMHLTQRLVRDVRVDLSRGDGGVAEHGLDASDVGAID